MKEKIIQSGIVNGEKMLVCPTWEDEFQKAINSTGGCFRISMDYSAVDVSWWKELEAIAKKGREGAPEAGKDLVIISFNLPSRKNMQLQPHDLHICHARTTFHAHSNQMPTKSLTDL